MKLYNYHGADCHACVFESHAARTATEQAKRISAAGYQVRVELGCDSFHVLVDYHVADYIRQAVLGGAQ